jgi:hypothetical protein
MNQSIILLGGCPFFTLYITRMLQDSVKRGDLTIAKFFVRWRMNPKVPIKNEGELNKTLLKTNLTSLPVKTCDSIDIIWSAILLSFYLR